MINDTYFIKADCAGNLVEPVFYSLLLYSFYTVLFFDCARNSDLRTFAVYGLQRNFKSQLSGNIGKKLNRSYSCKLYYSILF